MVSLIKQRFREMFRQAQHDRVKEFFACIISTKKRADKSFKQSFLKKDRKVASKHTLGKQNYIKTHFFYKKRQDESLLR